VSTPGRASTWIAGVVAAVAVVISVTALALDVRNSATAVPAAAELEPATLAVLAGLAQVVPGALLLRRLPRHPVAWVLVVSGLLWIVDGLAAAWAILAVYTAPATPGDGLAYWIYLRFGAVLILGLPVLLLIFPDGRLPAGRALRPLALASLAATALQPLALLVVPTDVAERSAGRRLPPELRPLADGPIQVMLPDEVWAVLLRVASVGAVASLVVPFLVLVVRHRDADRERRGQLRWLVWAALADLLVVGLLINLPSPFGSVGLLVAIALTSAAIVIAVTRYRLYDIDALLSATVVYGLLAVLVVVVDLAVVAVAGTLLGERDSALAALGIVALAYTPLRDRLWTAVRRLVRGSRDDPYGTVSSLAEDLEHATDPEQQLEAVARSVAQAFRLPWVCVEIERSGGVRTRTEHGRPAGDTVEQPIVYRGRIIGRVVTSGQGRLSDRDRRLFGDLVRQAAVAAWAGELSADLQSIRERLVSAREEERRRLRRELHDSLGPGLGAVTLRIETARNLAAAAPQEADRMLQAATADIAAALAEVRRLVHDLRPPALDELGLLGAVRQQAQRLAGDGLTISVDGELPDGLPAAWEVAAYRIASEAMTNVVRHARADRCWVSLGLADGAVEVAVRDDGVGIAEDVRAGVGTLSLRERAAELGGTATVTARPEGGTAVRAVLPLPEREVAHA
jgi:signal transduction histidine kinase